MNAPLSTLRSAQGLLTFLVLGTCLAIYPGLPDGVVAFKLLYFRFVLGLGLLALLAEWALRKPDAFHFTRTDLAVGMFGGYVVINALFRNLPPGGGVLVFGLLGGWYALVRQQTARADPQRQRLGWGAVWALLVLGQGVWALAQATHLVASHNPHGGPTGAFYNPAHLALLLGIVLPYLLAERLTLSDAPRAWRTVLTLALGVGLLVLPLTGSRTALLALAAGGAVVIFRPGSRGGILWRRIGSWRWLALPLAVGVGAGLFFLKKDSALGRVLVWKISRNLVADAPLTGHGLGGVMRQYNHYQAAYFSAAPRPDAERLLADEGYVLLNDYLQVTVEQGLLGLLLLGGLGWAVLRAARRAAPVRGARGPLAALVAGAVGMGTSYPLAVLPLALTLVFFIARIGTDDEPVWTLELRRRHRPLLDLGLVIVAVFVLVQGVDSLRSLLARRQWGEGFAVERRLGTLRAVATYDQVDEILHDDPTFRLFYGKALARARQYERSIAVLEATRPALASPWLAGCQGDGYLALGQPRRAEVCFRQTIAMLPNRLVPRYSLLAALRAQRDTLALAVAAAELLRVPVKVPSATTDSIRLQTRRLYDQLRQARLSRRSGVAAVQPAP